jgi:ribonuclease P protein component
LSTADPEQLQEPVDDLPATDTGAGLEAGSGSASRPGHWWAAVVPKRHARRAVTRNLVDRQVLAALQRAEGRLLPGMWLVRLRAPWPRERFPSADSEALRRVLRDELDRLLARCPSPPAAPPSSC